MDHLYIIGGQQRSPRPLFDGDQNWYEYQQGIILSVDAPGNHAASAQVRTCVEYVSPPEAHAPGDPVLFKCATRQGDRLYATTQTEVLTYQLPGFEQVGYLSLPRFNDVHHVLPTPQGNLLVANSGLEMVVELTPAGQVLREWNVLGEGIWEHFDPHSDYRMGVNLKPHRAHPNYVFYVGEDIWTTRFEQRDLLCLTQPQRRIPIGVERVHDGVYHQGRIYVTTVDGQIVWADPETLQVVGSLDLKSLHDSNLLLGWCRGLLLEGDLAWVGFSRIRPTKFRQAVSWVRQGFNRAVPSHIALYDLRQRRCLGEINVEEHGLNAVFSIVSREDGI